MSTASKAIVVVGLILVGWWLLWNTNPGKKLSAQVGLRECYEITLTGQVVCGDQAERLEDIRDNAREGLDEIEQDADDTRQEYREYQDCLDENNYRLKACAALDPFR